MIVPIGVKSHRVSDQKTVDPYQQLMMQEAGISPESFKRYCARFAQCQCHSASETRPWQAL